MIREQGMEGGEETSETHPQGTQSKKSTIGAIVNRTGARGMLKSVYLRDPDGNLIEISNYEDKLNNPR